jgi:hypothetical protein
MYSTLYDRYAGNPSSKISHADIIQNNPLEKVLLSLPESSLHAMLMLIGDVEPYATTKVWFSRVGYINPFTGVLITLWLVIEREVKYYYVFRGGTLLSNQDVDTWFKECLTA